MRFFWNEDFYYMVGWSDKHGNVSVFRVDRLHEPHILKEKAVKKPDDFNLDDYSRQIFEMYDGETVEVKLGCKNYMMKYVIDRFGEDIDTKVVSKKYFEVTVDVALSPNFYAWVFKFGGDMRILSPTKAVEELKDMLHKLLEAEGK